MGRQLQKRKNTQPSLNTQRSKVHHRTPGQKSRAVIRANPLLAQHWDYTLTPRQNYAKLGLAKHANDKIDPRSQNATRLGDVGSRKRKRGNVAVGAESQTEGTNNGIGEMKVVRDPISGAILRVVQEQVQEEETALDGTDAEKTWAQAHLHDGLRDIEDRVEDDGAHQASKHRENRLVDALERDATRQSRGSPAAKQKRLSPREREWCASMVAKHGVAMQGEGVRAVKCDWDAMCRDRKMNVLQLSRGQMREKIGRYLEGEQKVAVVDEE